MRTGLLLLMVFGTALGISGCGTAIGGSEGAAPESPLLPSLQVSAEGRVVTFALQLTNVGQEPLEVDFNSGQSFDFLVLQDGREVWRWSEDQLFTQAEREEYVGRGESLRYEAVWRPAAGIRGDFVAIGRFTSRDYGTEQTARFTLP